MAAFTNISAYLFAPLDGLKELREHLLEFCRVRALKGTILLSSEGVNLFIAGPPDRVEELVAELRAVPGLAKLAPKHSPSDHQPFNRMLVRIKKEIIAFGVDGIDPAARPSPKLTARELKAWLDEGRPVTLLDTRNDYEVKLGTFRGAKTLNIDHFRKFPEAVRALPEAMKDQPIVMFCTGGIRCEKAGPFMEREGFRHIHQLDGGILKYFEEAGGDHYDGECFVFDQRTGVDPALRETGSTQCYACLTPLTAEDQDDPRYEPPHSCPHCWKAPADLMADRLEKRNTQLRALTTPLLGAAPADNFRPLNVPAASEGHTLLECLTALFPHADPAEFLALCNAGRFIDSAGQPVAADRLVRAGERLRRVTPAEIEPAVNADIRVLHEDEAIVVLHKPAPLPMHACGRFSRNTLQHILALAYAPLKPRSAHRLDANTTGLAVFALTRQHAARLQPQFENGTVEKRYLARVKGHPAVVEFSCEAPIGARPVAAGARGVDEEEGQAARTEFRVLRRDADGTALVEARPLTGRTNQIRVHLHHLGHPVCGDPAYLPDGAAGDSQTLSPDDPPLCLHAWRLNFDHPRTGARMFQEAPAPSWAGDLSRCDSGPLD